MSSESNFVTTEVPEMQLTLDFESVALSELSRLLAGIQSLLVRSVILHLYELPSGERRRVADRALETLGRSYQAFLAKRRGRVGSAQLHGSAETYGDEETEILIRSTTDSPSDIFRSTFDDEVFDEWAMKAFEDGIVVERVESGSLKLILAFSAIALLSNPPMDYSMMKDMIVSIVRRWLKGLVPKQPRDTLGFVPEIVRSLARDKRIKKFELSADTERTNLVVEYWKA